MSVLAFVAIRQGRARLVSEQVRPGIRHMIASAPSPRPPVRQPTLLIRLILDGDHAPAGDRPRLLRASPAAVFRMDAATLRKASSLDTGKSIQFNTTHRPLQKKLVQAFY